MDICKPFRNATLARAPQAANLFDTIHVMRHLGTIAPVGMLLQ